MVPSHGPNERLNMACVLIADDEKSIRLTASMFLKSDGHDVHVAANAEQAFEIVRSQPIDVALVDILIGEDNGIDVAEGILSANPNIQVVLMTGQPSLETARKAIHLHAFDYLLKPANKETFIDVVGRAAAEKQLRDDYDRMQAEERVYREMLETEVRKQTEEIRKREERFRSVFNTATMLIASVDADGVIVECNDRVTDYLDYDKSEVIGQPIDMVIHPDDLPRARKTLAEVLDTGSAHGRAFRMVKKGGGIIDALTDSAGIRDRTGAYSRITCIVEDITQKKKNEEAVRRGSRIMEAMARAADELLRSGQDWVHDVQGMLRMLGESMEVARAYIFRNETLDDERLATSQKVEWTATGVDPQIDNPDTQRLPWDSGGMKRWRKLMEAGEPVAGTIDDLPDDEQAILKPQGILSIAAMPVMVRGKWWGFIGFDDCNDARIWSDSELSSLRVVADVLGALFERQAAEAAVQKARDRVERYLDIAGVMLIALDNKQTITMINSKGCEILGATSEEIVGSNWFDTFLPPEQIDAVKAVYGQIMAGDIEPVEYYDNPVVRADGTQRDIAWHNAVIHDNDGRIIGLLSSGEDVTEHRAAERDLQRSEERFTRAMAATRDGLYDWDLTANEIYYSPGWKQMLGYEDNELPNDFSVWEELTDPDDIQEAWKMQQQLISRERDRFELEFRMKHKDGHKVDILSRATAIFDDKGNAIRIVGTHVDITARKQMESEAAARGSVSGIFIESGPLEATYQKLADILARDLGFPIAAVELYDAAAKEMVFVGLNGLGEVPTGTRVPVDQTLSGEVAVTGQAVCEIRADQCSGYRYEALRKLGVETFICVPFHSAQGIAGTLALADPISRSDAALWLENLKSIAASLSIEIERKQTEEALRRSQERLRVAQATAKIGDWEFVIDTQCITWSDQTFHIFNRDPKLGPPDFEENMAYYLPEDAQRLQENVRRAIEEGHESDEVYAFRPEGGDIGYQRGIIRVERNTDGRVVRLFGTAQNVTRQKQAEAALQSAIERNELAGEAGRVGVWDWNLETNEIYVDPILKALLGYEDHEIRNELDDWGSYVHPDDQERVGAAAEAHLSGKTPTFEVEHRMAHRDGSIRWIIARGKAERNSKGEPVRVLGTDTDITDLKLAEQKLHEQLSELQRWQDVTLEREDRILGLKHEVNELLNDSAQPPRYPSAEE